MKTIRFKRKYSPLTHERNKKHLRLKKKYTTCSLATLRLNNRAYDREHGVCLLDVSMVNKLIWLLEKDRSCNHPVLGDIVRYTDQYGEYFPEAHIKNISNGICTIREQAGVYVARSGNTDCSTYFIDSGGSVAEIPLSSVKFKGRELKDFWTFGSCGACGGGAIYFKAKVNVWEYIHPQPYFEDYTTKHWRKSYVYKDKPEHGTTRYYTERLTFNSRVELEQYIKIVRGKIFKGHWTNQEVLFGYSETYCCITPEEWHGKDLPTFKIEFNGNRIAKYDVDDYKREVTFYYYYER